jgi:hypothetical protein
MSLEQATAAPIEVMFDGKKRMMYPLTVSDYAALKQRIKSERIETIENSITDDELKIKLIREVINSEPNEEDIAQKLASVTGIAFILWRALRDKDYTYEDVEKNIKPSDLPTYTPYIEQLLSVKAEKKSKKTVEK